MTIDVRILIAGVFCLVACSLPLNAGADSPALSARITADLAIRSPSAIIPIPADWQDVFRDARLTAEPLSADAETSGESADVSVIRDGDTPIALLCRFRDSTADADGDSADSANEEGDDKNDKDEADDEDEDSVRMARDKQQWRIMATPGAEESAPSDSPNSATLLPIQVRWSKYPFPTRPYTLRDFRLLQARWHPQGNWRAQKRFDVEPKIRRRRERKKIPRLTAHARTLWNLDSAGAFRLGAEAKQSCWFLFVDGALVADWRTAVPDENDSGTRLAPDSIRFDAGLHAVDLFTVVKRDEPLPNPIFAASDTSQPAALAEADLLPPVLFDSLRFEQLEDGEDVVRTLSLERRPHLLFEEAPGAESLVVPAPWADDAQRRTVRDFAPRHIGVPSLAAVSANLEIERIPFLQPLAAPFLFQPRLSVTSRRGQVPAERINLEVAVRSRSGEEETHATLTPESLPFAPRVSLSLTVEDESVIVRALFGEHQIVAPREVRLISAADFAPSLSFMGARAMLNDEPACLVWQPRGPSATPLEPRPLRRLFILDDFWDIAPVPGQERSGAERLSASLGVPVEHISVVAMRRMGVPDRVAKFAMLARAMETATAGDHILFAVGKTDLAEERQALDLVAELDFLAEVCRARRLYPIFVTVPHAIAPNKARARRTALYTKELAVRRAIPVADLYSAAKLDSDAPFFRSPPNDAPRSPLKKRRWIHEQMLSFLMSINH